MAHIGYIIRELTDGGLLAIVKRWDGYDSKVPVLTRRYDTEAEALHAITEEGLEHENLVLVIEVRP